MKAENSAAIDYFSLAVPLCSTSGSVCLTGASTCCSSGIKNEFIQFPLTNPFVISKAEESVIFQLQSNLA